LTIEEPDHILPVEPWREVDVEVTLDSGACDHVMDAEDAPGYLVSESPGSRRGQRFTVGNGQSVPNEGQLSLNLQAHDDAGRAVPVRSTFQVAEITRPLMSVAKVCENGNSCVFTKDGAQVLDKDGKPICKFEKKNGLYICNMKLKPPVPFQGQA
jgi:hypothetical protein